jgi:hypothetical protein
MAVIDARCRTENRWRAGATLHRRPVGLQQLLSLLRHRSTLANTLHDHRQLGRIEAVTGATFRTMSIRVVT